MDTKIQKEMMIILRELEENEEKRLDIMISHYRDLKQDLENQEKALQEQAKMQGDMYQQYLDIQEQNRKLREENQECLRSFQQLIDLLKK